MKILALETATDLCSVAVADGESVFTCVDERPRIHARRILAMVDECLAQGGGTLADMDALAFGRGPGSFTGIRIGTGVVQGLALGADLPVIPVSTLAAHAAAAFRRHGARRVAVCVDARMDECYWGLYEVAANGLPAPVCADRLDAPDAIELVEGDHWFGVGTGWDSFDMLARLPGLEGIDAGLMPQARDLLAMARDGVLRGAAVAAAEALPLYLRDEVAWQTTRPVSS